MTDQQQTPAEPGGQQPGPQQQQNQPATDQADELRTSLAEERKAHRALQQKYAELEREHMSESEKAVAQARAEGELAGRAGAAARLAAAEFRVAAVGKLADPDGALEVLDLGRLTGPDGEPDRKAIADAVERLAVAPSQQPARVPPGPRQPEPQADDFIRSAAAAARHG